MRLRRWRTFWAAPWSFQNSGLVAFSSRRRSSFWSLPSSKIAADVRGPRDQLFEALGERIRQNRASESGRFYLLRRTSTNTVNDTVAPRQAQANRSPRRA